MMMAGNLPAIIIVVVEQMQLWRRLADARQADLNLPKPPDFCITTAAETHPSTNANSSIWPTCSGGSAVTVRRPAASLNQWWKHGWFVVRILARLVFVRGFL